MKTSHEFWVNVWYGKSRWVYLLLPLSLLFFCIAWLRKYYTVHFAQIQLPVPVVVVGNISVGGTGKTPLIIAMVNYLRAQGFNPGVVSRGYGGRAPHYPYVLDALSQVSEAGDEPFLIFSKTGCKVCVAPDRVAAARRLIDEGCTIILSDDGMQHYRLGRHLEIAVVDGQRLFGNGHCLPAGPLREPISRLSSVGMLVINNSKSPSAPQSAIEYTMRMQSAYWVSVKTGEKYPLANLNSVRALHAIAGIGSPERFFNSLRALSLQFDETCFDDHHAFSADDFLAFGDDPVVMTEKDAVKCKSFAKPNWYALSIEAVLSDEFWQSFQQQLNSVVDKIK